MSGNSFRLGSGKPLCGDVNYIACLHAHARKNLKMQLGGVRVGGRMPHNAPCGYSYDNLYMFVITVVATVQYIMPAIYINYCIQCRIKAGEVL